MIRPYLPDDVSDLSTFSSTTYAVEIRVIIRVRMKKFKSLTRGKESGAGSIVVNLILPITRRGADIRQTRGRFELF